MSDDKDQLNSRSDLRVIVLEKLIVIIKYCDYIIKINWFTVFTNAAYFK